MGEAEYLAKCKTNIKSEELAFPMYVHLRKARKDMPALPKKMEKELKDLVAQVENEMKPNPVLMYVMMLCGIGSELLDEFASSEVPIEEDHTEDFSQEILSKSLPYKPENRADEPASMELLIKKDPDDGVVSVNEQLATQKSNSGEFVSKWLDEYDCAEVKTEQKQRDLDRMGINKDIQLNTEQ